MNTTAETGIAAVCMAAMLGIGIFIGGGDTITYEVPENEVNYQYVNYSGYIYRGEYRFQVQEKIRKPERYKNKSVTVWGEAEVKNGVKIVKLKTGRSAEEVLETCRHEVLHHYIPSYNHSDFTKSEVSRGDDLIYRLEDKVDFGVCEDVVATALKRQR